MIDMDRHTAIVNPIKTKNTPRVGPVVVMSSSRADLAPLCQRFDMERSDYRALFISRLYLGRGDCTGISLVGPFIGAPYAVMLLETLIAWGAERILFLGWCGAVSPSVAVGDIILPTAAVIDEGTSPHYGLDIGGRALPSSTLSVRTREGFAGGETAIKEGIIWSTDAIYRETPEKVAFHQTREVLAVEMELSALFSVGRFRQVDVAAVLVVSDELGSFTWRPGFKNERFKQARKVAAAAIERICRSL